MLASTEFARDSRYDFLKVDHKTSLYTKNYEYL